MAKIKRLEGYYLAAGEEHGPFKVGLKTKLQYERTARARKWGGAEEEPLKVTAFWVWHAAHEAGEFEGDFETFLETVDDADVVDASAEDEPENP